MTTQTKILDLRKRLLQHAQAMAHAQHDISVYLEMLQERHDQLTRRVEHLEGKVDALTNLDTARSIKLMENYERLSELQFQREEELDDLENLVLEPLKEVEQVLQQLVG